MNRRQFLQATAAIAAGTPAFAQPPSKAKEKAAMSSLFGPSKSSKPVLGIAEWYCYHMNFDVLPPEDAVEQCIAAHDAAGIRHLVWAIGRATIDYHSRNPGHTLLGGLGSSIGSEDWSPVIKLMRKQDTFRRAIAVSTDRGMKFWGRLGMNRHYGNKAYLGGTSRFSQEHPRSSPRPRIRRLWNVIAPGSVSISTGASSTASMRRCGCAKSPARADPGHRSQSARPSSTASPPSASPIPAPTRANCPASLIRAWSRSIDAWCGSSSRTSPASRCSSSSPSIPMVSCATPPPARVTRASASLANTTVCWH